MTSKPNTIFSEPVTYQDLLTIASSESKEIIQNFLSDESKIITADAKNIEKVFYPKSTSEVASIMKHAAEIGKFVTISGAGTGLTGARVAMQGWILSTDRLFSVENQPNEEVKHWVESETNNDYTVALKNQTSSPSLRVPVSIRLRTLQHLVKSLGLFYPPDTTEFSSFIGGNVATNASGARTFKYGPTRSYVQELVVVLSNGTVLRLDRSQMTDESYSWTIMNKITKNTINIKVNKSFPNPKVTKNAVGFPIYPKMPLIELFIGTEGIFGVITEVVLRLLPVPKNIFSLICYFETSEQTINFVKKAQKQKNQELEPIPMSVEYFDYYALQFMRKNHPNIPPEAQAAIYLEQDVEDADKADQYVEFWSQCLDDVRYLDSWAEMDDRGIEKHKEFRHSLPVAVNDYVKKNGANKVGTDFAVPSAVFDKFLARLKQIGDQYTQYQHARKPFTLEKIGYVIYGHIGNDHLHLNFLPRDREELHKAEEMYLDMAKEVVKLGGTISAEHGVGKKKYDGKSYIWYMIGETGINELRNVKKSLDPANILNRGNIFD